MEIGNHFGNVLKNIRKEKGFTQEQLAEKCDFDRVFISNLETGVRKPSLKTVFLLAQAFDMMPSEIVKNVEVFYLKNAKK